MNRREFLKVAGVAGVALVVPPVFASNVQQRFRVDNIRLCYGGEKDAVVIEKLILGWPLSHINHSLDVWRKSLEGRRIPFYLTRARQSPSRWKYGLVRHDILALCERAHGSTRESVLNGTDTQFPLLGWIDVCGRDETEIFVGGQLTKVGRQLLISETWHMNYVVAMSTKTVAFAHTMEGSSDYGRIVLL